MIIGELLSITNVILGMIIVAVELYCAIKLRLVIKLLYVVLGLYWAGLYVFIFLAPPGLYNTPGFSQIFIRPAFTVTLAVMAIGAIRRWVNYRGKP